LGQVAQLLVALQLEHPDRQQNPLLMLVPPGQLLQWPLSGPVQVRQSAEQARHWPEERYRLVAQPVQSVGADPLQVVQVESQQYPLTRFFPAWQERQLPGAGEVAPQLKHSGRQHCPGVKDIVPDIHEVQAPFEDQVQLTQGETHKEQVLPIR
jgi:hypothetical protein